MDDDFMVASIHRQYIARLAGFEVVAEAYTAASALQWVASDRPDLVLLDIYLPDQSGLAVMRHLAALPHPAPDVIAVTAARDVDTLQAAIRLGALQYIVKPFTMTLLHDKLKGYLAWRGVPRQERVPDQHAVDRLVGTLRAGTSARTLPKGMAEETLAVVEQTVVQSGTAMTSEEVAAAAGLSRVTARRYLDFLRNAQRVQMRSRYGSSGRPQHLYSRPTGPT
ncbi:MAG: response regulator [Actinomycetota bacterium]|nr:response regulator [Actinomycetota bacterium]